MEKMPKPTDLMVHFFSNIDEIQDRNAAGEAVRKWTGKCKICNHRVTDALGTTSNFKRHCGNHKKALYEYEEGNKKPAANQPTLQQSFQKQLKHCKTDARQIKITNSFVKNVIIRCGAPIYLVEQEGFRAFIGDVDPKWIPCSGKWISEVKLPELFSVVKAQLIAKFSSVQNVSATLDLD